MSIAFFVKVKREILYLCRLKINYSKIFISHSKSILKFFRTSFLASSPKAIKSFEEAFLLLIKKLQCFCDIWASPIDFPLKPTASINSQAFLLGGFLKVLPPVLARMGWEFSRFFCNSEILSETSWVVDWLILNFPEIKIYFYERLFPR